MTHPWVFSCIYNGVILGCVPKKPSAYSVGAGVPVKEKKMTFFMFGPISARSNMTVIDNQHTNTVC